MSDFADMQQNMREQQIVDPVELEKNLALYERTGNIPDALWNYWDVWQQAGGEDPNEFIAEMRGMIPQLDKYRGQAAPQEEEPGRMSAGVNPEWKLERPRGVEPQGRNAAEIFTNAIKRMTGK